MSLHHIQREFTPIGIAVALTGVVAVIGIEGFKRILKLGDSLNEGDNVVTGGEGEITIGFADGSHVNVEHDAEMTLDTDVFDPAAFKGDIADTLQAMRNAINAGQSADEVLDAASHGTVSTSPVEIDFAESSYSAMANYNPADNTGAGPDKPPPDNPPDGTVPPVDDVPAKVLPELTISDVVLKEPAVAADHVQGTGTGTTATAEFTVTLSEASSEDVTLHFRTVEGTATASGQPGISVDYQHNAGFIIIPAGETTATISITVNGDDLVEGNENFIVHLHHVDNAVLADNQGIGIIVDNEPSGQGGGTGGLTFGGSDDTPGDNETTDGNDIIRGTGGHDTLDGDAGDDVLFGAGGDDTLKGGHDDDILIGGAGDDVLIGNLGNDILLGQIGDDILSGNSGDDILIGGRGADLLSGGGGRDIFSFTDMSEAGDTITDFKANQNDAIDISDLLDGYSDGDDLSSYIQVTENNSDLQLHVDPGGSSHFTLLVTIQDTASQLSTDPVDLVAEGSLIINNNTIV